MHKYAQNIQSQKVYFWKHMGQEGEFSVLMYITHGTQSLTEDAIEPGTYPSEVYGCKKALETFF